MELNLQDIRDRKDRRKRLLQSEIERIKKQLVDMGAIKIIVFGSYAQGHIRSWSDLDIINVMPSTM